MSNNTQVMRNLLNDKKKLKDLKYIQNYSPKDVCTMYNNKNSALMKHVSKDAALTATASSLDGYCAKPATMLSKKEKESVNKIWNNLVQMIKSPRSAAAPVPVPAPAPVSVPEPAPVSVPEPAPVSTAGKNSIMNAINTLERNIQTLKARASAWEGAGGRRRVRHTRKQRVARR